MADQLLINTAIRDIIAAFSLAVEEKTGRPFIDFKWPNMLIYFHLINARADLYYQTRKQNQLEGNYEDYVEVLPCVEMREVDMVECPCAPASECTWMKSVLPMPQMVGSKPTAVTTLDGLEKYNFVEWTKFKHRINNRLEAANKDMLFTRKTIANKQWLYTYITKEKNEIPIKAQAATIAGVPIDPMEFAMYPICGKVKTICDILDETFIIEKRLTNILFETTLRKLLYINNATRIGDTKNDDRNAETSPDPRF